ncbi:hypothetical protein CDES_04735 [Corynebacterium deserti GIMN1.010]|uniref:Phosphatidylglycerol lysyltransferase C-terminal domain-containing protein n=1 Tax=Corynebacterium deserti GIMN1.010 TaxID=931089 RepID=A0A0M4CF83_9CORY|nr:phosphatidylglycerol lysyltransferase domain-containing protein [Corynebacterium deserti]ALC05390.1 hypothetical protein CDES_04735 [Corynebacterium deserti GIMN1.010]
MNVSFALKWIAKSVRFAPVSIIIAIAMWVLHEVVEARGTTTLGLTLPWVWTDPRIFTAGLTSPTRMGLVMSVLWIAALAVPAERILGSWKFLSAIVALHITAIPISIAIATLVEEADLNRWGNDLLTDTLLTPDFWVFGVAALASAPLPLLWRRRTRVVLLSVALTLLLYTGTLNDVTMLTSILMGITVGEVGRRRREASLSLWHWVPGPLSLRETRTMVAIIVTAVAAGPVVAALNPRTHGPFSPATELMWAPLVTEEHMHHLCHADAVSDACQGALDQLQQHGVGPMVANLMPLIFTIIIAMGLHRGRRAAWIIGLIAQGLSIAVLVFQLNRLSGDTNFSTGLNVFMVILPWIGATVVLLLTQRAFSVKIDRARVGRTIATMAIAWLSTAVLWMLSAFAVPHAFHPHATFALALKELPMRYLPPTIDTVLSHELFPRGAFSWAVFEWTGTIFWLVTAVMLYLLLMGVPNQKAHDDQLKAAALLRGGSGDHLSWMTIWDGNSYWWAPHDAGYVAYRVKNGVAVTLGEPVVAGGSGVGSVSAVSTVSTVATVAAGFEDYATSQGWVVAWYSVGADFSAARVADGQHRLRVAEEAVLRANSAEFKGKKFQNVRTARNRALKEGISSRWTSWAEVGPEMQQKIIALSEEWVSNKALPEMGFTLGTVTELADADTRLLLAVDESEHLHGVTSWLPVYTNGEIEGYTLDVMRRDPDGFRSVIEFLMSEAVVYAHDHGIAWMSMSGAPLSTAPSDAGTSDSAPDVVPTPEQASSLDAILDLLGKAMEPFYGFQSLAASKNKFHPEHHRWYVCYRDELNLPGIGIAVAAAYVGDFPLSSVITRWMPKLKASAA